jgi:hypothetical protein
MKFAADRPYGDPEKTSPSWRIEQSTTRHRRRWIDGHEDVRCSEPNLYKSYLTDEHVQPGKRAA